MPRTRLFKGQARGEFPWTVLSIFMAGQFIGYACMAVRTRPRHRRATGAMLVEMGDPSSAYPLARDHNAVQRAQAFDPSDKPCAVVDEGLAFAAEPFGVFFLDGRNANVSRYRTVATEPGSQDTCHFFRVQPVGLGPPSTARFQEARRIEHHRPDADLQQDARQPETVIPDFVADRELERAAESKFRTNPLPIEPFHQARVIARLDCVQAPFGALRRCKGADPFRLAEFEGDAASILRISDLRHGTNSGCCAGSLAATQPPLPACIGSTTIATASSMARPIRQTRRSR